LATLKIPAGTLIDQQLLSQAALNDRIEVLKWHWENGWPAGWKDVVSLPEEVTFWN
jgi:hypothetical protein